MREPLVITVSHTLGKQEALRRVRPALGTVSQTFPVLTVEEEVWSGDRLDFRVPALGQAAVVNVQVGDNGVRLEVDLPWLLRRYGEGLRKTTAGSGRMLPLGLRRIDRSLLAKPMHEHPRSTS